MRRENDYYPTPHSIIRALFKNYTPPTRLVWEPCAGDGRLATALFNFGLEVITSDISSGDDFFLYDKAPQTKTIITNPPFSRIRDFIDYAFKIGIESMALVCPERLWACKRGLEQFKRHRPSRFANLTWREDYLGKGGAPDRALAVSVWDSPCAKSCQFEVWDKPNG